MQFCTYPVLDVKETRKKHIEGLKRLLDKSEMLGVSKIRCFDSWRENDCEPMIMGEDAKKVWKLF